MIRKQILYFISTILFMLFSSSHLQAQDYESFRLMVFGDSLSSGYHLPEGTGYIPQLQKALNDDGLDNVIVLNSAIPGNTTSDGLKRIDKALKEKPHAVIIELGANDLFQSKNLEETEKNLQQIISTFKDNGIAVMLIGINLPLNTNVTDRQTLSQIYKSLVKKNNLVFYPNFLDGVLTETFGVYNLDNMLDDSVHPNEMGIKIMVKKTYPVIKKFLMSI